MSELLPRILYTVLIIVVYVMFASFLEGAGVSREYAIFAALLHYLTTLESSWLTK